MLQIIQTYPHRRKHNTEPMPIHIYCLSFTQYPISYKGNNETQNHKFTLLWFFSFFLLFLFPALAQFLKWWNLNLAPGVNYRSITCWIWRNTYVHRTTIKFKILTFQSLILPLGESGISKCGFKHRFFFNRGVKTVGAVNLIFLKLKPYLKGSDNHMVSGKTGGVVTEPWVDIKVY